VCIIGFGWMANIGLQAFVRVHIWANVAPANLKKISRMFVKNLGEVRMEGFALNLVLFSYSLCL